MKKLSLEQMEVVEGGTLLDRLASGYCKGIAAGGLLAFGMGVALSGPAAIFVAASGAACLISGN